MIIGEKVIICGLTHESVATIYDWVNQPELRKLTGTLYPISEYEHEAWIKQRALSNTDKLFLIKDKITNDYIGTIGIKNIDWINSNAELFISIGNFDYVSSFKENKKISGYGSDAVNTLCEFCFNSMGLHKVYLHVFESNIRAIRSYEKAGFEIEGELKEHHFSNGKFENIIIMAKFR